MPTVPLDAWLERQLQIPQFNSGMAPRLSAAVPDSYIITFDPISYLSLPVTHVSGPNQPCSSYHAISMAGKRDEAQGERLSWKAFSPSSETRFSTWSATTSIL